MPILKISSDPAVFSVDLHSNLHLYAIKFDGYYVKAVKF